MWELWHSIVRVSQLPQKYWFIYEIIDSRIPWFIRLFKCWYYVCMLLLTAVQSPQPDVDSLQRSLKEFLDIIDKDCKRVHYNQWVNGIASVMFSLWNFLSWRTVYIYNDATAVWASDLYCRWFDLFCRCFHFVAMLLCIMMLLLCRELCYEPVTYIVDIVYCRYFHFVAMLLYMMILMLCRESFVGDTGPFLHAILEFTQVCYAALIVNWLLPLL